MGLHPQITELTTAATDAAIALVAIVCAVALGRHRSAAPWRAGIWCWILGLLALAGALGAVVHGLDLAEAVRAWLWRPLFLSLGVVVALFLAAALLDLRGRQAARASLIPLLAAALLFMALAQVVGTFLVFILYEAAAMLAALWIYGTLTARRRLPGAAAIAAGIVLNLAAAAIQASGSVSLTIFVPFDHNGVFHLVQIVALVVLTAGVARGMPRATRGRPVRRGSTAEQGVAARRRS